MTVDEKDRSTHFAFGENWASYAETIDQERIDQAAADLERLLGPGELRGRTMLDIGCGSGLHALAARQLGVRRLVAIDIDPQSVETTRAVLGEAQRERDEVRLLSVFDLKPDTFGTFDVVYSWGVLHHTGAMYEALERAAACVAPKGIFAFALYRKTLICGFWKKEKRWYSRASVRAQSAARAAYTGLLRTAFLLTGRDFRRYVDSYKGKRGMSYEHDVHDWLGGYPYESITPTETDAFMRRIGFQPVRSFVRTGGLGLVMGCDEYVYRRA
jgi:2-polyprenyl-6-hydroxyphenyl methylase/3-demethylubiquinone-9 3-methyltransferase